MKVLAATDFGGKIGGEGLGPFGNIDIDPSNPAEGLRAVTKIVSSIIGVITIVATIWFLFQFLVAGINWISSGGDKTKLNEARDRLTHAFIGLLIVVAGWAILAIAGQFLGYNTLIDPEAVINQLGL